MRVIAGSARGLRIEAPPGEAVRPTSDRVREATFNALGSMGLVSDAVFVDLFAGSGALGIEALSRGAAWCTFCEADRSVADVLERNLERTGTAGRAEIIIGDATGSALADVGADRRVIDVAVADPPYGFDGWEDLLARVPAEVLVAESDRGVDAPEGWRELRLRRYGSTVVTILERTSAPGARRSSEP